MKFTIFPRSVIYFFLFYFFLLFFSALVEYYNDTFILVEAYQSLQTNYID